MGLKCVNRVYMLSYTGLRSALLGSGVRSSNSVWGGCLWGKIRSWRKTGFRV